MHTGQPVKIATAVALAAWTAAARADDVPVPINLQADLLYMIAGHDRNLPARAGVEVRTLVVAKAGDDATRAAAQFKAAASARGSVAGIKHVVEAASYTSAAALADTCRAKGVSVVWLAPGFTAADATAIGGALSGVSVLTAAASPAMVKQGVVLGFELAAGRTRIVADLTQAAKQRVAFGPDVLGLMAVSQ